MQQSSVRMLLLAALLVLAGCNGLGGESRQTVTPIGSTDASAGVSSSGVAAGELARSHGLVLADTNYTVRISERISKNGTLRSNATRIRRVGAGEDRYRFTRFQHTDGFPDAALAPQVSYWYDGSTVFQRVGTGEAATISEYPTSSRGPLFDPSSDRGIERIFGAFTLDATRTANGSVHLQSTGFPRPDAAPTPAFIGTPRNGTLTAHVASRGYVRSYQFAYEANATGINGSVRVVRHVRFEAVGETAVTRPAWASKK